MAFKTEDVLDALREAGIDTAKQKVVLESLKAIEKEKKEEKEAEKGPKTKNQFVVFVMDDGTLSNKELIGYVLQVPESASISATPETFRDAARAYNNGARKAKKYPITTIGDGMKALRGKWIKDTGIKVKTKESIAIIPVKNEINDSKRPTQSNN